MMNSTVAIRKCDNYNPCEILNHIEWLYKEANGPDPSGKKILLKPNILSDDDPLRAVTTHPAVVEAVTKYLRSRGAEVFVGDSPTFDNKGFTGKKSGIRQAAEYNGATWVSFTESPISLMVGTSSVKVAKIVNEVDFIINLPKLKTHELMLFTGAIKNVFGLVPSLNKVLFHAKYPDRNKLAEFFVELEEKLRPQFTIMDGIISMEGPGPGNGSPKKTGILLASVNPLALDITACKIIGYDPHVIPINRIALKRGILLKDISDIEYRGEDPDTLAVKNFRRITGGGSAGIVMRFLKKKIPLQRRFDRIPVFNPNLCTSCMKCVNVCPVNALTADANKKNTIILDNKKCIRCYCCHELCRDSAIDIRRKIF